MNDSINQAVTVLNAGGLVGLPTETVYGLAADAHSPSAIKKIFAAKGRPADHPLIVHIADISQLSDWARDVTPLAMQLARRYWPGPMTLILKKHLSVFDLITGGQDTVGIRLPAHPIAREVLQAFGRGVVAPSANRFGRISPTTAAAVFEELGNKVDLILDGGASEVGLESTIIDVTGQHAKILRPGMISAAQIEAFLASPLSKDIAPVKIRVSGSHDSHYAPVTLTRMVSASEMLALVAKANPSFGLLAFKSTPAPMPDDPQAYAHCLYQRLRALDKLNLSCIYIEDLPADVAWDAIRDRVYRASSQ